MASFQTFCLARSYHALGTVCTYLVEIGNLMGYCGY